MRYRNNLHHLVSGRMVPGDEVGPQVGRTLTHQISVSYASIDS